MTAVQVPGARMALSTASAYPETVVLHPPFRWQQEYARTFADGVALREDDWGIRLAVENMFPWRARSRSVEAYLPHWDPRTPDQDSDRSAAGAAGLLDIDGLATLAVRG